MVGIVFPFSLQMTYFKPSPSREQIHGRSTGDEPMVRGMPAPDYATYLKDIPLFLTPRQRELVSFWLSMGREDPTIFSAGNPPFDMGSFCWWDRFDDESAFDICRQILCWSPHPGDAIVIGEICLIRQKALQWLVFNGEFRLGSITLPPKETPFENAKRIIGEIVEQIETLGLLDN